MTTANTSVKNSPKKQPKLVAPTYIDVFDCFTNPPPELDFAFAGLLAGSVGALVAPGGTGKSMLALNIALAVATGFDLTGGRLHVTNTGKVTYLSAEDDIPVIKNRVYHLGKHLNSEIRHLAGDNFFVGSLRGESEAYLLDSNGNEHKLGIDCLIRACEGQRLVILDTLRKFHHADENNSGHMSRLLSILEYIAKLTGCSFLIIHHTNKSATTNGNGDKQGASRGSSVLVDNIRYQANLLTMSEIEACENGILSEDAWRYVKYVETKVNYKVKSGDTWLVKKDGGVLVKAEFICGKNATLTVNKSGKGKSSREV